MILQSDLDAVREVKSRAGESATLVFVRKGAFYELLGADADEGARLLALSATTAQTEGGDTVRCAAVPFRAIDGYLNRLMRMGHRVLILEPGREV